MWVSLASRFVSMIVGSSDTKMSPIAHEGALENSCPYTVRTSISQLLGLHNELVQIRSWNR